MSWPRSIAVSAGEQRAETMAEMQGRADRTERGTVYEPQRIYAKSTVNYTAGASQLNNIGPSFTFTVPEEASLVEFYVEADIYVTAFTSVLTLGIIQTAGPDMPYQRAVIAGDSWWVLNTWITVASIASARTASPASWARGGLANASDSAGGGTRLVQRFNPGTYTFNMYLDILSGGGAITLGSRWIWVTVL